MALSYFRSFETPVTVIRPFNTYGPRQSARAIIPTIISQILAGKTEIKLGNLKPTRDLNYVKDTANGFIEVGLHEKTLGDVFNLGTGKEISIGDLVQKIIELTGKDVKIVQDEERMRPSKSEVERLLSNSGKALNVANWKSQYSLEEGLKGTIEWIRKNPEKFKADIYNV